MANWRIRLSNYPRSTATGRIEGLAAMQYAPVVEDRHAAAAKFKPNEVMRLSRLRHGGATGAVVVKHGLGHVEGEMRIVAYIENALPFIPTDHRSANTP